MHDDQHGTAIISAAALLNALELTEKKIDKIKMVVNGAGAAAISCTKLYKAFGVKAKHIVMLDSKGVIRKDRENLTSQKAEFATDRDITTLDEAMLDADVFIGLSKANVVSPEMLKSMAKNPIVFAMANPNPEIEYNLACKTRDDILMATGRSDHPNQVNNVLGFPFIFRGALDVRATKINEEMKMAAVRALAELTKEPVPEQVNITYDTTRLTFGKDYIIPKPFDPRLIAKIPPAIAKAAMDSGVAKAPITDWEKYEEELMSRSGNDNKVVRLLHNRAKVNPKRIVFAEAELLDVLKAAQIVYEEGIAIPILLGDKEMIEKHKKELDFDADVLIIDPRSDESKTVRTRYADKLWELRKRKGDTRYSAKINMGKRNYYGSMMLIEGDADGMISGYSRAYPKVLKPVFEVVGKAKGVTKASTVNIMITERGPLFLADTSINISPNAEELAEIAQMTANVASTFGFKPVVAMLSYANFGSSSHKEAQKVRDAVKILHENNPSLVVDGEIQTDFALSQNLCNNNFPFSKLAGKKVNTLIFPNLDAANINYKLIKGLNNADSIGPIIIGLKKSVHILQLGASVDEMVNMAAVAVIDAQEREKRKKAKMTK